MRLPVIFFLAITALFSCKKSPDNGGNNNDDDTITVIAPPDPELASTIGFFMNNWVSRNFEAPSFTEQSIPSDEGTEVLVDASSIITKVSSNLFGNNANLWMGQLSDQPLLTHLTNNKPGIIRFPGGSISDVFFWNADKGVKPAGAPDSLINDSGNSLPVEYWYGKNTESWTCSVDNYYTMLQQTQNEGMITINYGYARYGTSDDPVAAAAHLAADWVRYDNGRTKYWEIGNENNGSWEAGYRINTAKNKDGQPEYVTGDIYGQHFKVFADSMRAAASETGHTIYIGAQLVEHAPEGWEPATTQSWNTGVLNQVPGSNDYYIVHSYFTPYYVNSGANEILNSGTTIPTSILDVLSNAVTNAGAAIQPIAMTEWNIFATGSKQMVSHIAGMHGIIVMNELLKNKYGMASRWDLANGWDNGNDHGLFSQGDEPGAARWNPRPIFYYQYFFRKLMGDRVINATSSNNNLSTYATTFSSGQISVTLVNKSTTAANVHLKFKNFNKGERFYWFTLTGGDDNSEFSRKVQVNGEGPSGVAGGPDNYTALKAYSAKANNGVRFTIPPRGVILSVIDKK